MVLGVSNLHGRGLLATTLLLLGEYKSPNVKNSGSHNSQCLSFLCFIFSVNKVLNIYDRHGEHRSDVMIVLPGYGLSLLMNLMEYPCRGARLVAMVYTCT